VWKPAAHLPLATFDFYLPVQAAPVIVVVVVVVVAGVVFDVCTQVFKFNASHAARCNAKEVAPGTREEETAQGDQREKGGLERVSGTGRETGRARRRRRKKERSRERGSRQEIGIAGFPCCRDTGPARRDQIAEIRDTGRRSSAPR